ncbi:bifunctional 23S rRNA (guanine(2069)-N(7))-methyltransferase RlmK/23S rRNA (guanine(2445)-N(2))-methyltransferase RlmL [Desulfogranum mediterraneum]|uniref:bifunctional 23S rRNA (guanine(2069)-N(7))-methyltransferase RlmK/23S rRNA (guanine(2445)-N(2))-methyltransferase RlmL n=1 Tax=Desulfogranum mediterraneum TaxID=160661 RepID=UPI000422F9C5|nr:bifunctional 23S rRNA (guanine(2069)-N(7))-methyltransferase RlmK/23S rRNA (guanine(2445)-N(2))-methyltransferase RlmL [Desulfogranum mediterraneum]
MAIVRRKHTKKKQALQFTATCGSGLESLVEEEIISFGGRETTTSPGAVSWTGTLESAYRACLWSRCASRVLLELSRFDAADPDILYRQAGRILWDEHFDQEATFAVFTTLVDAKITHSQYASLRVKDAIVDQFRKRFGKRPTVDTYQPAVRFHLHINGVKATLSLDLSGDSLHRRGYRNTGGEAPLKETLAAALIQLSGFLPQLDQNSYLLDPMCGSGTLLIEAALKLNNSAPGLLRKHFGFMGWQKHDPRLWDRLIKEALELEEGGVPEEMPQIIGYDADPRVVAAARQNVIAAGLRGMITIRQRQLAHLQCPGARGFIITNPPYGDRLSEKQAVKYLYRFLGERFRAEFKGWQLAFFTGNPDLAEMLKLPWQERHKLFNGPIRCQLLVGGADAEQAVPETAPFPWTLAPVSEAGPAEDFANRLRKNCQIRLPWAEEEGISCFRIYDRDIPEYNLSVDLYEEWVHVQEYAPPSTVSEEKAAERFNLALQSLRQVLEVPHSRIFIKTRKKQKGKEQYQKKAKTTKQEKKAAPLLIVREGGCRFLVNFTDYLDTGLFLDHRRTRAFIGRQAQGLSFLNLFGYTGSATVFAARGGASATTTVDISDKYLQRAQANLSLNGYGGPLHQTVEADCLEWLRRERSRYGLIFVDPPTFSNARHRKTTFDIQSDHQDLLELAMQRLARKGLLVFSTNFRKFKLAPELSEQFLVEEITETTLPPDFARKPPIHRCWTFRHPLEEQEEAEQF